MSVSDIVSFLKKNNIPDEYCEKFRGIIYIGCINNTNTEIFLENYIDGKEFLNLNEQEVRSMVSPIGLAKKIIRLSKEVKTCIISLVYFYDFL